MANKKHDWNSKENYYTVHYRTLKKYEWRFMSPITYRHTVYIDQYEKLEINSALFKTDSGRYVEIKIEKDIEIDIEWARRRARTFSYSYQAKMPSPDGRVLVRYDSPHESHRPFHHKHIFDELGNAIKVVTIDSDSWPHVSEFLDEVAEKY